MTIFVLAALVLPACSGTDETAAPQSSTPSATDTSPAPASSPAAEGLPDPVANTRAAILAAAAAGDYDLLAPLVEPRRFLSDFGFGIDPIGHWRNQGTAPLEAMATLLNMRPAAARKTNEGTLYEWPRFNTNSKPEEMSPTERAALLSILDEHELEAAFLAETGYTGPRLGILADGSWWFFVQESGA